jgi:hypothetical protein
VLLFLSENFEGECTGRMDVVVICDLGFRHAEIERLGLEEARKRRPMKMLRQPIEKRKNAETSVKSSTKWERICVAILFYCGRVRRGGRKKIEMIQNMTYKVWKIPRAPRPNSDPNTGKNRSKNFMGQLISETIFIINTAELPE